MFSVRDLTPLDFGQFAVLFRSAFSRDPVIDTFQWKYFSNPSGAAIWKGAFDDAGNLVASGAMVSERSFVFSEPVTVFKCTDLMVSPEHQGKGLASSINAELRQSLADAGCPLAYTLCSRHATHSFVRNGWGNVARLKNYFKPKLLIRFKNSFIRTTSASVTEGSAHELSTFKFWHRDDGVVAERSPEILSWRMSNPEFRYGMLLHWGNSGIDGYLLYGIGHGNVLYIIDLQSSDGMGVMDTLLAHAEQLTLEKGCRGIACALVAGAGVEHVLKRCGYLSNPFEKGPMVSHLDFNVLSLKPQRLDVHNPRNWEILSFNYDDV